MEDVPEPFAEMLAELSDGERWKLAQGTGWEDFVERMSRLLPDLPLRRRQAVVMLLFALVEGFVTSDTLSAWLHDHDAGTDSGLEEFIVWLRQFRPRD